MSTGHKDHDSNKVLSAKLRSLHSLNKEIKFLKRSLRVFCEQRDKVESEIALIRASTAPITRIPVEVLSSIFRAVLRIEYNDLFSMKCAITNRKALLMVCRQWHDVVLDDPLLWNFLMVKLPKTVSIIQHIKWIRQEFVYIDTCLSRSKEAPLDILLNLEEMQHGAYYTMDRVRSELKQIVRDDESEEWLDNELEEWLEDIDWDPCPAGGAYEESLVKLITAITGKDGCTTKQWRSLHITLPAEESILVEFWDSFNHPFPRLCSLSLEGFWVEWYLDSLSFAFLSAEAIELTDIPIDWIPPCPKLNRLRLVDYKEWSHEYTGDLKRFTQVAELAIIDCGVPSDFPNSTPITLPALDHFDILTVYDSNMVKRFECGQLGKLTIDLDLPDLILEAPIQLFTAAKSVVIIGDLESHEDLTDLVLSDLLTQFSSAHTIQVHPSIFHQVLRLVGSLREKEMLRSLRTVIAGDEVSGVRNQVYSIADDNTAILS
jgi:hypothetical protein